MIGRALLALLVLIVLDAFTLARGVRVTLSHVKTEQEPGWIHLRLDMSGHAGHNPHIARIDWCSATSSTSDKPRINRDDGTCVGRNVMHKRIYPPPLKPGERYPTPEEISNVIRIRSSDMSVFINPAKFGGLDTTREAYVMVYTQFDRIPPPPPQQQQQHVPTASGGGAAAEDESEHDTSLEQDTSLKHFGRRGLPKDEGRPAVVVGASKDNVVVNVLRMDASASAGTDHTNWQAPLYEPVPMQTEPGRPYEAPWYVVTLGLMACAVGIVVVVAVMLINKEAGGWSKWSRKLGLKKPKVERYYGDTEYSFAGPRAMEMRDDDDEVIRVDVKKEERERNLDILMRLGEANYAFRENL